MRRIPGSLVLAVVAAASLAATACAGPKDDNAGEGDKPAVVGSVSADDGAPRNKLADSIVACMKERGWDAEAGWDGSVGVAAPIPTVQLEAYEADYDECLSHGQANLPAEDDEFKRARYAKQLAEKECLEAKGYSISEAPSEQTYMDAYGTKDEWFPMQDVDTMTMSRAAQQALFTDCPPPEWY